MNITKAKFLRELEKWYKDRYGGPLAGLMYRELGRFIDELEKTHPTVKKVRANDNRTS